MIPAVLDHLWQSTLVVLGVALLMPVFRKVSAAVRYGLWFAASLKFLVPFAALAALGRLLAPAVDSHFGAAPAAVLIVKAAQPFSQVSLAQISVSQTGLLLTPPPMPPITQVPAHAAPHLSLTFVAIAAWAAGCIAVLVRWVIRSQQVRRALRQATPLAWPAPMPVLASPSLLEPGLVGLLRPVLVIPQTLPTHLGPAEIDAILAHEACHLRRRDNLTAAVHMLVEALFWFHPLVWWIGARLIEERERACDEAVIRAGHDCSAYARSLLESARLYLESPLSCVAGASGFNLKARVEAIMTAPASSPLSRSKKALLLAAGALAFATPVAAGLLTSPTGQAALAAATSAPAPVTDPSLAETPPAAAAAAAPKVQDNAPAVTTLATKDTIITPDQAIAPTNVASVSLTQNAPMQLASLGPIPSVDAPFSARRFLKATARSRMLPSVRPVARRLGGAGPYGSSRIRSKSPVACS